MKKSLIVGIISASIFIVILNLYIYKEYSESHSSDLPIYDDCALLTYDVNDIKQVVGASDYVFVAKINYIDRTEYRNGGVKSSDDKKKDLKDPNTIYNVEVIKNIKGELPLNEGLEIVQYGGLNKNKKSYSFINGGGLLEADEYYIILASVPFDKGELHISGNYTYRKIDIKDSNVIEEYKVAYDNEIIPEIKTNNNLSIYDASLS